MIDFSAFPPDPARAEWLDARVRNALAASLGELFEVLADDVSWDPGQQAELLDALPRHRVAPGLFAAYAELVDAVVADDLERAQQMLGIVLRPEFRRRPEARVVTLGSADLGEGMAAIYRHVIADDPESPLTLNPVDAACAARLTGLFARTIGLLEQAVPALAGEIAVLAHERVIVEGGSSFGGASSFYLWGTVALNASRIGGRTGLAEALAHEAGHAYLLGATLGAPLVQNDPAERYASPLRADPRPMDGIVHASFVLARMVWCQEALLASGALDGAEEAGVRRARDANAARFTASRDLVVARADFTETGGALWRSARGWMDARRG